MAFENSLKYALGLQGGAKAFQQTDGVCLAHSMRWMTDQILGREFGAGSTRPLQDTSWLRKIQQVVETEDRRRKAAKLYKGLKTIKAKEGGHQTAQATREHLSNKFGQQVEVEETLGDPSIAQGVDAIKQLALIEAEVACMISLRTAAKTGFGSGLKTFNHAVALVLRRKIVRFFDPNMGEVSVPAENFAAWFDRYHSEWSAHHQMKNVNSISVFNIRAPADVSKYVKSLKRAAEEKFQDEMAKLEFGGFDVDFNSTIASTLSIGELDVANTISGDYAFMENISFNAEDWT